MNNQEIILAAHDVWRTEAMGLEQLCQTVDDNAFCDVVRLIAHCTGKIIVSGCGTSGEAARKIAHSLCCVERPACFLSPSAAAHGGLGILQKEDVFILLSKGGNTHELLGLADACKTKGAVTVAVTEDPASLLAQRADRLLLVKVPREPCPFNMLATASTMAVIGVFDAACIALMELTGYTREQFLVIHPGGAVGEKLANTNREAMD